MGFWDTVTGATDWVGSLVRTGYSIYQDQRDTKYQHALQQDIFNREDNAVQRRVADLEAAGLNKQLSAGTSAGAGAVVGRSSAQQIPQATGALDMMSALEQLKQQREQTNILKEKAKQEKDVTNMFDLDQNVKYWQSAVDVGKALYDMGVPDLHFNMDDHSWYYDEGKTSSWQGKDISLSHAIRGEATPLMRRAAAALVGEQAASRLSDQQANWYARQAIADMIFGGINAATNVAGTAFKGVDIFAPKFETHGHSGGSDTYYQKNQRSERYNNTDTYKYSRFHP